MLPGQRLLTHLRCLIVASCFEDSQGHLHLRRELASWLAEALLPKRFWLYIVISEKKTLEFNRCLHSLTVGNKLKIKDCGCHYNL